MQKTFYGLQSAYDAFASLAARLQSPLLLLIRLYWGWQFGSSHPGTCQFVFCDGSVQSLKYGMSPNVFHGQWSSPSLSGT